MGSNIWKRILPCLKSLRVRLIDIGLINNNSKAWKTRSSYGVESRRLLEEKAPVNDFGRRVPGAKKYGCK